MLRTLKPYLFYGHKPDFDNKFIPRASLTHSIDLLRIFIPDMRGPFQNYIIPLISKKGYEDVIRFFLEGSINYYNYLAYMALECENEEMFFPLLIEKGFELVKLRDDIKSWNSFGWGRASGESWIPSEKTIDDVGKSKQSYIRLIKYLER